jgi:hypothetical protein
VTIGIGLWLTAAGATLATICAIIAAVQTKKRLVDGGPCREHPPPPPPAPGDQPPSWQSAPPQPAYQQQSQPGYPDSRLPVTARLPAQPGFAQTPASSGRQRSR